MKASPLMTSLDSSLYTVSPSTCIAVSDLRTRVERSLGCMRTDCAAGLIASVLTASVRSDEWGVIFAERHVNRLLPLLLLIIITSKGVLQKRIEQHLQNIRENNAVSLPI